MADVDPDFARAVVRVDVAAGKLDRTPATHHDEVMEMYAAAWGSCVRGRVRSLRARTGTAAGAESVGEERLQARVAARLALGWMTGPDAVTLEGGSRDDVLRVQMGVSAALLRAVSHPDFPVKHATVVRELCFDNDRYEILNLVRARQLAAQPDSAWPALHARLLDYVRKVDDAEEVDFTALSVERTLAVWARENLSLDRSANFHDTKTKNLYNRVYFASSRAMRERDNADVDVFVWTRVGNRKLEGDPPTPMMLGTFPHLPSADERPLLGLDTEGLFADSLVHLTVLGNQMRAAGFTTTSPLIEHAIGEVDRRLTEVVRPPAMAATRAVDLRVVAAEVDRLVEGLEDQQSARKDIAAAAKELLVEHFDRILELIDQSVGLAEASESDGPLPGDPTGPLVQSIIGLACQGFQEREQ